MITHEMITSLDDRKKKKDLALKVSSASDDCDEDEDEESTFRTEKFISFLTLEKGSYDQNL